GRSGRRWVLRFRGGGIPGHGLGRARRFGAAGWGGGPGPRTTCSHPNLHAQDLLDRPRDHLVTATVGEALGLVRAGETEQDGVAVDPDRADITAGEHHPGESTSVLHRFQDLVPGALEAPQV